MQFLPIFQISLINQVKMNVLKISIINLFGLVFKYIAGDILCYSISLHD